VLHGPKRGYEYTPQKRWKEGLRTQIQAVLAETVCRETKLLPVSLSAALRAATIKG
jgi:hypothetical protein